MCDSWRVLKADESRRERVHLVIDGGRGVIVPSGLVSKGTPFFGEYIVAPSDFPRGVPFDLGRVKRFEDEETAILQAQVNALQGEDSDLFRVVLRDGRKKVAVHLWTFTTDDYLHVLDLDSEEYEHVIKTDDPMTPEGITKFVKRVLRVWEKAIGEQVDVETEIWLTHLLKSYDWTALGPDEVQRILDTTVFIPSTVTNPEITKALIEDTVKTLGGMITAIKENLASAGGVFSNLDTALTQADVGALEFVSRNGINYFPQSFSKSSKKSAQVLLKEVYKSLEQGEHYQKAVERALEKAGGVVTDQRKRWWKIAAHQLTHRARERGRLEIMHSYAVEVVRVWAVLDEHTTPICEFLHGQVVRVTPLYQRWQEIEANNVPVDEGFPWVQIRRKGEEVSLVASGVTFAKGQPGAINWVRGMNMDKVLQYGVGLPPYHPLCRSTAIYEIEYT